MAQRLSDQRPWCSAAGYLVLGSFVILDFLDEGGMGQVFKAPPRPGPIGRGQGAAQGIGR